ncbi:MAG: vanadium-dependent haloperoxidase [bacterium]|nr:vanadium-dependent haloperoxidase [bacterium]
MSGGALSQVASVPSDEDSGELFAVDGVKERFDLRDDNAMRDVALPYIVSWLRADVSPGLNDASVLFRYFTVVFNAAFDAVAPYHETAIGVYSRLGRRPVSLSGSNHFPNIAVMYAVYHSMLEMAPHRTEQWRRMMWSVGLDPDHVTENLATAAGIGHVAARNVLDARRHDGFNHFGDETPGFPFMDTTGFVPVNGALEVIDPSRWQPLLVRAGRNGVYVIQNFVTPQYSVTEPYAVIDPREHRVGPPSDSDYANLAAYRAQAESVLELSASLTDRRKMLVEFFDLKARDIILSPSTKDVDDTIEFVQLGFLLHMAQFDAGIVAWQEKARYDAVRPITAIRYLYGDELVSAWGGPGRGTVELPASQWVSYVQNADHSDYPSGTTIFCAAYAQAFRRYSGSERIEDFTTVLEEGSSVIEPEITPAEDLTIRFETWTEYEETCGESRLWAGVHFRPSVDASLEIGGAFGDAAYDYWETLIDGTAPLRGAAQKLAPDPLRDTTHWTAGGGPEGDGIADSEEPRDSAN